MIAKACKFYQSSKCILKDKFCDLNCNQAFFEEDTELSREMVNPTRWQMDNKELERSWSKMR